MTQTLPLAALFGLAVVGGDATAAKLAMVFLAVALSNGAWMIARRACILARPMSGPHVHSRRRLSPDFSLDIDFKALAAGVTALFGAWGRQERHPGCRPAPSPPRWPYRLCEEVLFDSNRGLT